MIDACAPAGKKNNRTANLSSRVEDNGNGSFGTYFGKILLNMRIVDLWTDLLKSRKKKRCSLPYREAEFDSHQQRCYKRFDWAIDFLGCLPARAAFPSRVSNEGMTEWILMRRRMGNFLL